MRHPRCILSGNYAGSFVGRYKLPKFLGNGVKLTMPITRSYHATTTAVRPAAQAATARTPARKGGVWDFGGRRCQTRRKFRLVGNKPTGLEHDGAERNIQSA